MLKIMAASTRPTVLRHSALGFGPLARNLDADVTRSWMEPLRTDRAHPRATPPASWPGSTRPTYWTYPPGSARFTRPVRLVWGDATASSSSNSPSASPRPSPSAELTTVPDGLTFVPLDAPEAVAEAISMVTSTRTQQPKDRLETCRWGRRRSLAGGWVGQEERVLAPHADAVERHVVRDRARRLGAHPARRLPRRHRRARSNSPPRSS